MRGFFGVGTDTKGRTSTHEGQDPEHYDEYGSCYRCIEVAEATPYRDVEFGLREVEAKRRILRTVEGGGRWRAMRTNRQLATYREWADRVVQMLALPYADHADYCEEWRP